MDDFEEFFAATYERVVRSLVLACGDQDGAEEAAQEAFARALRRWPAVSGMQRPGTWVFVVAIRYYRRYERRRGTGLIDGGSDDNGGEDPAAGVAIRVWVNNAIETLPKRQRLAVVLRFYADLSVPEIASAMRCSTGTVKSTLHAALAHLKVDLDSVRLEGPDHAG